VRFRWKLHPGLVCGESKSGTYEHIAAIERAGIRAYVAFPTWENKSEVWSTWHLRVRCGGGSVALSSRDQLETLERASHRRRTPDLSRACVGVQSLSREPTTARRAARGAKSPGRWRKTTWNGSAALKRPAPTRKLSASERCGSNPCLGKPAYWHGLRRFRLRRLWRVNCEALLVASGQNLKRLLQSRGS
jgi:hypothetical protein